MKVRFKEEVFKVTERKGMLAGTEDPWHESPSEAPMLSRKVSSVFKVMTKKKLSQQNYITSKMYFKINVKDRKTIFDKRKVRESVTNEPKHKKH